MPLDQEQIDKFSNLAKYIVEECGYKLSSLTNKNVSLEYKGMVDSLMGVDKITIKKDSFLVHNSFTSPEFGPISLIVSNQQVVTIADLVMGGDGKAGADVKPDETNQMVYAETLDQVFKALFERLEEYQQSAELKIGEPKYKELQIVKASTLDQPEGIEDSVAMQFLLKFSKDLEFDLHVEVNSKLIEYVQEKLEPIIDTIDLVVFKDKVKSEYLPQQEIIEEEAAAPKEEMSDDAYKIDQKRNLSILTDINLDLVVELGRSEMLFSQLLKLGKGSAIELERQCNEPVDLYAHNQLIAKGEVVAIDDCFGLKITEILGDLKLAKKMGLSVK